MPNPKKLAPTWLQVFIAPPAGDGFQRAGIDPAGKEVAKGTFGSGGELLWTPAGTKMSRRDKKTDKLKKTTKPKKKPGSSREKTAAGKFWARIPDEPPPEYWEVGWMADSSKFEGENVETRTGGGIVVHMERAKP